MMALFFGIVTAGTYLFFVRARRFDLFTLAFAAALVYFLPGFFGHVRLPPRLGVDALVPILPETYGVFCAVLASIVVAGLVFEALPGRGPALEWPGSSGARTWAALLAMLGFALAGATSGRALLDVDKDVVLGSTNRFYLIATTSLALLVAFSFARRSKVLLALCGCGLAFDLFVGNRDTVAFAALAIGTLHLAGPRKRRLLAEHWRVIAGGLLMISFLFIYKSIAFLVKSGLTDQLVRALSQPELYERSLFYSEPFVVQATLNEVFRQGFHADPEHLLLASNNLLLFANEVIGDAGGFNKLFQPALFPYCDFGMANEIWAEMIASGGWWALSVFLLAFNGLLAAGSYLLRIRNPELRAAVALLGAQWAFYIHRNDLAYQLNIGKRTFVVAAVCIGLSSLLWSALRSTRAPGAES